MGAPLHLYKTLIQKNKIFTYSSNYTLYGDMSSRVMSALNYFIPNIEVYSIDEAFLSLKKLVRTPTFSALAGTLSPRPE